MVAHPHSPPPSGVAYVQLPVSFGWSYGHQGAAAFLAAVAAAVPTVVHARSKALAVSSAQIGGVFACNAHAGAASKCLAAAMAGLAVVLAGASWLLINTACQFSHTQVRLGGTQGQCLGRSAVAAQPLSQPPT